MTASHPLSSGPLSPHLLLSLALGQSPVPDDGGRITLMPWRLRREALGRSPGTLRDRSRRPQHPPAGEAPPDLTVADVMTRNVVSVSTATPVSEIARALAAKRISAVPVVSVDGSPLGIVSEGDLLRRAEIGTQRRRSWWRKLIADTEAVSADFERFRAAK